MYRDDFAQLIDSLWENGGNADCGSMRTIPYLGLFSSFPWNLPRRIVKSFLIILVEENLVNFLLFTFRSLYSVTHSLKVHNKLFFLYQTCINLIFHKFYYTELGVPLYLQHFFSKT